MLGSLPTTLEINGNEYGISTDYRNILQIITAYADPGLEAKDKAYVLLRRIYRDGFFNMPSDDYAAAIKAANAFIECREHKDKPSPRVVNWEKDEQLIFPAINKVAGQEVRALPYLHWWTFLGYFQNIDAEGTWGFILTLRQKKAKGKKLEKHEKEFWNANRLLCAIDQPKDVKDAKDRADSIFDEILREQKEGGGVDGQ